MSTKLKWIAAVLAIAGLGSVTLRVAAGSGPAEVSTVPAARVPALGLATKAADEHQDGVPERRESVAPSPPTATPDGEVDAPSFAVDPYLLKVHVVDAAGASIHGATVAAWDAEPCAPPPGRKPGEVATNGARHGTTPIQRVITDQAGRCTLQLDRALVFVHAAKDGVGASNDRMCGPELATREGEMQGEVQIGLRPDRRLRGQVLRADGLPAGSVMVRAAHSGGMGTHIEFVRPPAPTRTDADGHFALDLRPGTFFTLTAEDGTDRVARRVSTIAATVSRDVVMRFPGAFSIHGALLDPRGEPVASGQVRLWEDRAWEERNGSDLLVTTTRTKAGGAFEFTVQRLGRYLILGVSKGFANSELARVEVTASRPRADTVLTLLDLASIAGVVRHRDGSPLSGVRMTLTPEQGEHQPFADRPTRRALFSSAGAVTTAADGSFRFGAVDPKATYTLTCCPDAKQTGIRIKEKNVWPGRQDIVMVLSDAEIRGSSITGEVVADDTGKPITDFRIDIKSFRDDGSILIMGRDSVVIEPGRYTLTGLTLGEHHEFSVVPEDGIHAPCRVGPIVTRMAAHVHDVRLQRVGGIACRVLDAAGEPIVNALVGVRNGKAVWRHEPTKAGGSVRFAGLAPGGYAVYVVRDGRPVDDGEKVDVVSGRTAEVELRVSR